MKLLIFTQKVDKNDSTLGFFHSWLAEISKGAESVEVICLGKRDFDLPRNVTVYSLGKERGLSKLGMFKNLYRYLFLISGSYDKVFVHMNEEYILLCGFYWKLKGIPIYLWRNHPRGSMRTRIAVAFSTKVFCTAKESFTARFKKTVIMPAGIDTKIFHPTEGLVRKKYSVCMVGRISTVKHIELGIQVVEKMVSSGSQISLEIVGPILKNDSGYYDFLKKYVADNNLSTAVRFTGAVSQDRLPEIYSSHEVCLNLTQSGSFDKTIVEASLCGAIPLVSNTSLKNLLPEVCLTDNLAENIAKSIRKILDPHLQLEIQNKLQVFGQSQSLEVLMDKLFTEMK